MKPSSRFRSCAHCQRSSGSLARQALTTRSRPGGTSGVSVAIGGGSVRRIAAITLAWLVPVNGRCPVSIS